MKATRKIRVPLAAAFVVALAACAAPTPPTQTRSAVQGSVVPGTIGVAVAPGGTGVVVSAVGAGAGRAGVRVGDRVLRYNGIEISTPRQFERLVLDSAPGTTALLELSRDGDVRTLELPVEQVHTGNRA